MTNNQPASRRPMVIVVATIIIVVLIIILTAIFIPQNTNPAYAASVSFVQAAGRGNDAEAEALVGEALLDYIEASCPDGSVSACVDDYTPAEWGGFLNAVFRRAQPDGPDAFDVLLLATYEEDQGFSGVCIYNRVEQVEGDWQIIRWSGWISCDEPNAGLSALAQAGAPNAAP